jgi:hypothetical protein
MTFMPSLMKAVSWVQNVMDPPILYIRHITTSHSREEAMKTTGMKIIGRMLHAIDCSLLLVRRVALSV